jgi:predicted aspartyl protease
MMQSGPAIPIQLTIAQNMAKALAEQGKSVPTKQGMALIDTGASRSAIDEDVAKELGLPIVNVGKMTSASHEQHPCNLYPVQFSIPPAITFQSPQTMGAKIAPQGYIAIIGRDFLAKCVFIYNGGAGTVTLCL